MVIFKAVREGFFVDDGQGMWLSLHSYVLWRPKVPKRSRICCSSVLIACRRPRPNGERRYDSTVAYDMAWIFTMARRSLIARMPYRPEISLEAAPCNVLASGLKIFRSDKVNEEQARAKLLTDLRWESFRKVRPADVKKTPHSWRFVPERRHDQTASFLALGGTQLERPRKTRSRLASTVVREQSDSWNKKLFWILTL